METPLKKKVNAPKFNLKVINFPKCNLNINNNEYRMDVDDLSDSEVQMDTDDSENGYSDEEYIYPLKKEKKTI